MIGAISTLIFEIILYHALFDGPFTLSGSLGTSVMLQMGLLFPISCLAVLLFLTGKVPFDLIEAESELIDGVSIDISGGVFSSFYAAEVVAALTLVKFFVGSAVGTGALFAIGFLFLLLFIGRIFLTRFLFAEMLVTFLSTGLAIGPLWLLL